LEDLDPLIPIYQTSRISRGDVLFIGTIFPFIHTLSSKPSQLSEAFKNLAAFGVSATGIGTFKIEHYGQRQGND
jgi:hypothetical protein